MLSTTSANHFNFAASGLDAGEHTIEVYAKVLSHAETNGSKRIPVFDGSGNIAGHADGEETMETVAGVSALVKLGSLTVKEVQAADKPEKVIVAGGIGHH